MSFQTSMLLFLSSTKVEIFTDLAIYHQLSSELFNIISACLDLECNDDNALCLKISQNDKWKISLKLLLLWRYQATGAAYRAKIMLFWMRLWVRLVHPWCFCQRPICTSPSADGGDVWGASREVKAGSGSGTHPSTMFPGTKKRPAVVQQAWRAQCLLMPSSPHWHTKGFLRSSEWPWQTPGPLKDPTVSH